MGLVKKIEDTEKARNKLDNQLNGLYRQLNNKIEFIHGALLLFLFNKFFQFINFLRKDRNVPYVTIEVKDKKVTQVEGDMNNRFISKGSPEYEAIKEWAALNKFGIL